MFKNNRTVWSEGMFLGPHHFQQNDRFMLHTMGALQQNASPYPYGLQTLEVDENALSEGQFAITQCRGIFADGTPFSFPEDGPLPEPLEINSESVGSIVSLGLPFEAHAEKDIAETRSRESFARYLFQDLQVDDKHSPDTNSEESVFTASLWVRLQHSGSDETAFHTIPVCKIKDCQEDGSVVLDKDFLPCAMSLEATNGLSRFCRDLEVLLAQRASDLAGRLGRPDSGDTAQLTQFFMLQIINRAKPLLEHILATSQMHPEVVFRELVQLAGELATFCRTDKLPVSLPAYNHRDQFATFNPLMANIRESLNFTVDQKVQPFPVEHVKGGIYTCTVPDINLFHSARFLIAVTARVPQEDLRHQFSQQTTIASKDKLRDLVTSHLSGVRLNPMVQVPNNIPMYEQHLYFELERGSSIWSEIATTGIIAMHIAGNFPEIKMQLWTINQ